MAVTSTHAARALGAADLIIHTLDELPCVLATEFDAPAVLRGPLPTP